MGIVVRAHPTQGIILVAVQNGYELNELHDVKITSASNGQVLKYDSAQGLWVNGTDVGGVAWGAITGSLSSQLDLDSALSGKLSLLGGTIADACLVNFLSSAADSTVVIGAGEVKISSNTLSTDFSSVQYNSVTVQDASGSTIHTATGIVFADATFQSTAYAPADVLQKSNNLSEITATASTARTNLGLGTMAVETASNYLTTASASSTYFTIASAANKADLASPTFSGTPTLPTGTIGVTQSPGNNTTALATTAFVTAATPAASTTVAGLLELATRLEVVEPSSSTLAVSPMRALDVLMNPGYVQIAQNTNNVAVTTSGTGASSFTTSMTRVCIGPNVSVAGFAYYRPQTNGGVGQFFAKGINNASINFSKPFWMSGRSLYDDTFRGDANNTSRITVGKSATGAGALAQKGIGWQKVGGLGSNFFLLAHNGTTLTSVDTTTSLTSLGITGGVPFDWSVYSDGAGNVTMFINNVQVATTSAGPTGYSTGSSVWQEEIDQTASAATRMYFTTFGGHYYHA